MFIIMVDDYNLGFRNTNEFKMNIIRSIKLMQFQKFKNV